MARPIKCRKVRFLPDKTYFNPLNSKGSCLDNGESNLDDIILKVEELEAMRLKDIEGLTQQESADKMGVSRQTFQNIIDKGRKKVAIALTEGKAIHINGGNYAFNFCKLKCESCNETYDINYMRDKKTCPVCNSEQVVCKNKKKKCNSCCK